MKRPLLIAMTLLGLAGPALADVALIVGNEDYETLRDLRGGADVVDAVDEIKGLGFDVIGLADATGAEIQDGLTDFIAASVEAERVMVVLSGRFVHSSQDAWLLGVDQETGPELGTLSSAALPLSTVLAVLAAHPGRAMLLIGEDGEIGASDRPYLKLGANLSGIPQGVTVLRGSARAVAGFAEDILPLPAMAQTVQAARQQGLLIEGYAPEDYRFIDSQEPAAKPAKPEIPAPPQISDAAAWKAARSADTIASYQDYLRQFPQGVSAADAKRLISEIETEPNRADRLAEDALRLSRDQKRAIQRNLSILDFDPRGIDGMFGEGSRTAISRWQKADGAGATGYLTAEQIARLDAQAARRAAELEAEAEKRRLEQERDDRAYWAATGAAGDEPGLRAYLKRYPDGVYAELAQTRLKVFDERKRAAAAQADRTAWEAAVAADSIQSYRDYITANPQGAFAEEARARIEDLTEETGNQGSNASAQQAEQALQLNKQTRSLIEGRLEALGLKPGKVDGEFDNSTRRAIRRYQRARDMPVTGYLNQQTVVRLMADSILRQ